MQTVMFSSSRTKPFGISYIPKLLNGTTLLVQTRNFTILTKCNPMQTAKFLFSYRHKLHLNTPVFIAHFCYVFLKIVQIFWSSPSSHGQEEYHSSHKTDIAQFCLSMTYLFISDLDYIEVLSDYSGGKPQPAINWDGQGSLHIIAKQAQSYLTFAPSVSAFYARIVCRALIHNI